MRFRDHFASLIESGSLAPGTKLPPERALSDEFSINRVTVRQALSRMEAEGLI
ncbi:MAG: winged helix-turn-helix transcriptional regulator, partial [Proteobacteria bacterium]|nr:winged helix-turn-helix transcriptional regulator [Pseudomonadota bacterium]